MNVKILDFQNKKNKLKSRYIDSLKRCKSCSDGNIRMLTNVNVKAVIFNWLDADK